MSFRRAMMMASNYVRSLIQSFVIKTSALNAWYEADYCLERSLDNMNVKNLLYNASLVITPNSYKESNLYAVIPNSSIGNITFTRNSTATKLNSSGFVEVVPSQNLLQYSQQFNLSPWTAGGSTITPNAGLAPDRTNTAYLYNDTNASSNPGVIAQQFTATSNIITCSVYLKASLTTINRTLVLRNDTTLTDFDGLSINLNTGVFTGVGWTVVALSNGWYRCIYTKSTDFSIGNLLRFYTGRTAAAPIGATDEWFAWGAQVTPTSSVQTYFPTTTRLNVPRANYLIGDTCPTLLLEPQRSNLYLNSATLITRTNVVTTAIAYTVSFYGTGTITFTGAYIGSLVGTGANNLVSITFTTTTISLISTVTGSVTNAQLEAGSFPTSYIPTTTTLVTRIIDALTVPTPYTSNLITSLGGTLLLDLKGVKSLIRQGTGNGIYIGNSTINTGNCFVIRGNNTTATFPLILKYVAGTVSTLYTLNATSSKIVIKWDGIYINVFINGTQVVTNSAFTTTNMNNFISNSEFVTNIKTMALYPLPLTDAQCLSLSTQ
jgi:hypothetical protein